MLCSGSWTQVVVIIRQTTICEVNSYIYRKEYLQERETVSIKNIIRTALLVWPVDLSFSDWSPLLPYMADGTANYAEKVGDTQQLEKNINTCQR